MRFKGGLHLIVQLAKEVGGGGAAEICFHYRLNRAHP